MKKMIGPLFLALALLAAPLSSQAGVFISVNFAPPALPVYEQPVAPGDGYIWTPGYWSWDADEADYYWVPGTWVEAPQPGYLWTPGYWGWENDVYIWHGGYWGEHVGFYGGVNYGYGYNGDGFHGGEWRNGAFFYNRSVSNINVVNIHNTYNERVVDRGGGSRVSFNGGQGGISARENEQQRAWANERHIEATSVQEHNREAAHAERSQFAKVNQGRPAVFATARAGEFKGAGVVSHGQATPFHPTNGAYNKGGQPGGAGERHGAPAYVQHQREAEGQQHTMIQPQQHEQQQQRTQQVQQQREQQQQRSQQMQQQREQQQQRSQQMQQQREQQQQRSQQMQQQREQQQQRSQQMQQQRQQQQQRSQQMQQQRSQQMQQQREQQQQRAPQVQQPHPQQAPHPQGGQPHGGEPHQEHH